MTGPGADLYGPVIDDIQIAVFFDDFETESSPFWGNERGNWFIQNGNYGAQFPSNNPATYTSLPFLLRDFTVELDVDDVSDGGVWLRSNFQGGTISGVLLITGGWAQTETGLYWHIVHDDTAGGPLSQKTGLFTQGDDIHVRIEISGDTYTAWINDDPATATTITSSDFHAGYVGLYDFSSQRFDNVLITANTAWPDFGFGGTINMIDSGKLSERWLDVECYPANQWCDQRDLDYTGSVSLDDLMVLINQWLSQ